MGRLRELLKSPTPGALASGIALSLLYLYFFAFKAHVELDVLWFEPGRAWFNIYWADEGEEYSQENMSQVLIDRGHEHYQLFIGGLGSIERLRIDPVEFPTKIFLKRLDITQPGYAPIELNPANGFAGLEPVQQIDQLVVKEDGLRFNTTGRDGQFELRVDKSGGHIPVGQVFTVLAILALSLFAGRACRGLLQDARYVPALLLVVFVLALVMAAISRHYWLHPNGEARIFIHPDEEVHATAVEYYRDHWLPPAMDDPEIAHTFSVYGYSRLATHELYYPVAGYLTRFLAPFGQEFMWDARLVGLFFLALMLALAWRYVGFRPIVAPLLITPQVWYLYSYSNSDGFALLLASFAAWQAADRDSLLNRALREPARPHWLAMFGLGALAGSMLLLKQNFYFFVLFLGFYFLWRIFCGDFPDQKRFWSRLVVIVVIGLAVYGSRWGLEIATNGWDSRAKIHALIEEKAERPYKPSTKLHGKHIYLYMRERGWTLEQIWNKEHWGTKSFGSSFGAYGYTQYFGSNIYYNLVQWTGIALLAAILVSLLIHAPPRLWVLYGITIGSAFMLVGASVIQSWLISFQAQGRYLAPILPMLGVLYYHARPWLMQRTVHSLLFLMFGISVWSFLFIGLALIPKIS